MRKCLLVRVSLLLMVGLSVGLAQDSPNNSGITRQQAGDILNELKEIRQLLQSLLGAVKPNGAATPPLTGKMTLDGGYSMGSKDAPLIIVEFTDYQCPYCRQFHSTTFGELRKKYIDSGKVRFVIRDFPLVDSHPAAMRAAMAAHCANDQGQFLAMHEALFGDPSQLGESSLINYARSLKLDVSAFQSCLAGGKHKAEIQNDMTMASSLQINGTPSFLVGKMEGEEISGAILIGAQPLTVFESKLRELEER